MRVFHHTHSSHNSSTIPTTAKNLLRHAIITGIIIVGTMQVLFSKVFRMLLDMNGSVGRLQSKFGSMNQGIPIKTLKNHRLYYKYLYILQCRI